MFERIFCQSLLFLFIHTKWRKSSLAWLVCPCNFNLKILLWILKWYTSQQTNSQMLRDELQCKRKRSYRLKLMLSDLRENGILLEKKTLFPTANIEQLTVHNPSQCRFFKKKTRFDVRFHTKFADQIKIENKREIETVSLHWFNRHGNLYRISVGSTDITAFPSR